MLPATGGLTDAAYVVVVEGAVNSPVAVAFVPRRGDDPDQRADDRAGGAAAVTQTHARKNGRRRAVTEVRGRAGGLRDGLHSIQPAKVRGMMPLGVPVRDDLVDLPALERGAIALVLDAHREALSRLGTTGSSSRKRTPIKSVTERARGPIPGRGAW